MRSINRLALALMLALLAACSPSTPTPTPTATDAPTAIPTVTNTPAPTPTAIRAPVASSDKPAQQASVRIVHASPDLPAVDIYIEGLTLATNLSYSRYGDATSFASGDYNLKIVNAGAGMDGKALLSTGLSLQPGVTYTLLLTGSADKPAIKALAEADDPLSASQSRVAVINAVAGATALTVTRGGTALLDNVPGGDTSAPVITPSGSADLVFAQGATTLLEKTLDLRERTSYTYVLIGQPQSPSLLRFETRVDGRASVRVIHAASVGSIAASLDGETPLTTDTPYGHASETKPMLAGSHTLDFYLASGDPNARKPIASISFTADPDASLALILIGPPDQLQIIPYAVNLMPTAAGQTRIAFMNTQQDVPLARVTGSNNTAIPGLPDFGFGQAPSSVDLPAGRYDFYSFAVQDHQLGAPLESGQNLELGEGIAYLYLLTKRAFDAEPLIISDRVGIAAPPATEAAAGASIRFVNAVEFGNSIDFSVGPTSAGSKIAFGQAGDFVTVPSGDQALTARIDGGKFAEIDSALTASGSYTAFAYQGHDGPTLLLVSDDNVLFDNINGRIRFVNLSPLAEMRYGMASTGAIPADQRLPEGTEEEEGRRLSLPMGAQRYVQNINGGAMSTAVSIKPGDYDIFIVDELKFGIARRLEDVTIEANRLYDVVAFQRVNSEVVTAFAVPYPAQASP